MCVVSPRLKSLLDENFICYESFPHITDYTAQETSEHTHTPGRAFAKAVIVWVDRQMAMVVLPAHRRVRLADLALRLHAREVQLCSEAAIRRRFEDCDVGAIPPFGNLYDMDVYLCSELADVEAITFNAGSHEMALRISMEDYRELVQPNLIAARLQPTN